MSVMNRLRRMTYVIQHSPNCSKPFLVRLVGRGAGTIDLKPPPWTNDVLGYGKTMERAARNALQEHEKQLKIPLRELLAEREKRRGPQVFAIGDG